MQRYKSKYTGPQMDVAFERALPGGAIDLSLSDKQYFEFLDNTDFTNPVAQAGIGGMHGSVAYALDRWILVSGTVSGNADGLTLNGTIRQIREFPIGFDVVPSIEMHSGTASITYDDSTKYCDITSSGGVIKRPHLGLIAITDWSEMPRADYDNELRECRRYYRTNYTGAVGGIAAQGNGGAELYASIIFDGPMRTIPVTTIKSVWNYSENAAWTDLQTTVTFIAASSGQDKYGVAYITNIQGHVCQDNKLYLIQYASLADL